MKRLITVVALIGLAGLWVGAAYAQHHGMPAGTYVDYIDLGTLATEGQTTMGEAPHNMLGWGPTAPGTIGGGYGGIATDGGSCRPVWSPTEFDIGDGHEPWADIDLDFGPAGGTKTLHVRYLDGSSTDDQSYYIDSVLLGSIETGDPGENWYIESFDVSGYVGTHTLRIEATEAAGTWWDPYGQVAIDQIGVVVEIIDPIVAPVAVDADPINCSGSKIVNFHYTPGTNGDLRGYTVRVACDAPLTFDAGDITFFELPTGVTYQPFVTEITPGLVYDVDYVIMGGSVGIATEADLFSVEFHGAATGAGIVSMTGAEMSALDGTPIAPVDFSGTETVTVDCTPPDAPTMTAEPGFTQGTVNTVAWSDESGSGAAEYYAECSTESDFDPLFGNSGWIATQSHEFSGLADGQIYYYRVKARDALLNESAPSASESSTQDDTAPESSAGVAAADVPATFDVTYTASDAVSGVAGVELFYRIDGGSYASYGVFTSSPIAFDASGTGEGFYEFYTEATDDAGNVELPVGPPDAGTTVDMTAPETHLADPGPFQADSFFDVTYVLDLEDGSGLADVELWYKLEAGGTYALYGDFTANPLPIDTGGDGTFYFYTVGTDNVGNREDPPAAQEGDAFTTVDSAVPVVASFVIDDDDPYTNALGVILTCTVTDATALTMRFNNDGGAWSAWEPWAATKAWDLEGADGLKTVNAEFMDAAGNDIAAADDITLDTDPPVFTSMVINGDATYTNALGTILTSSVTGADQMRFQNEGGAWSAWEAYNATYSWDLEGADGLKRVNAEYQDQAGNVAGGFDEITLDTSGPTFTSLVINGGATHTNDLNVTLASVVTDAAEMRFNNDGGAWSAWETYNPAWSWVLAGGEGDRYVYAEYRDVALNTVGGNDFITYDLTAPGAVSATVAARGHDKVTVSWAEPGEDEVVAEIWRAVWYDTLPTTSAYPEYDDLPDDAIPTRPSDRAAASASGAWQQAGTVPAGTLTLVDAGMATRGIYYYEVFVQDAAGNWSASSGGDASAINYLLGDLTGAGDSPDGDVTLGDISVLGAAYGTLESDGAYDNECDVGPTDDYSGAGIPDTDNVVDFDDLMIFALNWDITVAKSLAATGSTVARFSWVRVDETTWSLALAEPCADLKGVNLRSELPEEAVLSIDAGSLLGQQESRYFLQNIPRNGLDAGLALLGNGARIIGKGELFRVKLAGEYELDEIEIVARNAANLELEYSLEENGDVPDMPSTYGLSANYPNPFNPSTRIDFALPEAANVRLEVFGVDGRRIAVLKSETMPPGRHTVTWQGRDDQGALVATGVYFYRLRAGDFNRVLKMTLLK